MITLNKKLIYTVLAAVVVMGGGIWLWSSRGVKETTPPFSPEEQAGGGEAQPESGIPAEAGQAAESLKIFLAEQLGVSEGEVEVVSASAKNWPDACLGLARAGQFCAQVITAGYEITVKVKDQELKYRTNQDGSVIRQDAGAGDIKFLKG